jgi:hypothetical protein
VQLEVKNNKIDEFQSKLGVADTTLEERIAQLDRLGLAHESAINDANTRSQKKFEATSNALRNKDIEINGVRHKNTELAEKVN